MHLADEMLDHLLRHLEIGDDAVAHGPDGLDIAGGAAQHHLGVVAHRPDRFLAAAGGDGGDHRRLVEDDATALHIDQRVRCPKIDCHVARESAKKTAEHQ